MPAMEISHRWVSIVVSLVIFIFVFSGVIFVKLPSFLPEQGKKTLQTGTLLPTNSRSTSCRRMCITKECIMTAGELITSVDDLHRDPCADFHAYSCGNRLPQLTDATGEIPTMVVESTLLNMRNVINEISDNDIHSLRQLKIFYENCVNFKTSEYSLIQGLSKILSRAGLFGFPHLSDDWNFQTSDGKETSIDLVLSQFQLMKSHSFVETSFRINKDRTAESSVGKLAIDVTVYVSTSVLMKRAHIKPEDHEQELSSHKELIQNIFEMLNTTYDIHKHVADVIEMEKGISIWLNQTTLAKKVEWKNLSGSEWERYVQLLLLDSGIDLEAVDVQVASRTKSFRSFLEGYSDAKIAKYLGYRFVRDKLEEFGFFFREFFQSDINKHSLSVILGFNEPKWKDCIRKAAYLLQPILTHLYLTRRFNGSSLAMVNDIYYSIRNTIPDVINDMTWMNETSKNYLKVFIDSVPSPVENFMIYTNATFIELLYDRLEFNEDTYFGNMVEYGIFRKKYSIKGNLNEGYENPLRSKGLLVPIAQATPEGKIVLGLGLFDFPGFSATRSKFFNIAMLGSIISHEFVHVIQLKIDKTTFRRDDTSKLPKFYSDYKHCVVKHYSSYKYQYIDKFLPGKASFREDFADLLGAEISYRAYKQAVEQNDDQIGVLGLDVTEDQLFFVLFAQYFCQHMDETVEDIMASERYPHTPNKFRILGTASNLVKFAKAFKCPENSPMNPQLKCNIFH